MSETNIIQIQTARVISKYINENILFWTRQGISYVSSKPGGCYSAG